MAHKLARRRAARCACPAPGVPAGLLTRERAANPSGRARGGRSRPRRRSWNCARRVPEAASGPLGTVASSSARHGRLRRNAVSPHGVRIGGASGAPLWIGCSSANRALAGKLLWDGIVAVPRVFDSGCPVLFSAEEHGQPGGSARSGDAGERVQPPGRSPAHLPSLRTHSDARRNARRCGNRGHSAAIRAARINSGPPGGRCIGSTGLAGSPRRPRIMEGPLVSDTTELLSGAPSASEDAPVGSPAPAAAAGGSAQGGGARSDGIDIQVAQSRWHWPFLAAHARAAEDRANDGHTGGRPDAQGTARRGDPGPAGRSAPAGDECR